MKKLKKIISNILTITALLSLMIIISSGLSNKDYFDKYHCYLFIYSVISLFISYLISNNTKL